MNLFGIFLELNLIYFGFIWHFPGIYLPFNSLFFSPFLAKKSVDWLWWPFYGENSRERDFGIFCPLFRPFSSLFSLYFPSFFLGFSPVFFSLFPPLSLPFLSNSTLNACKLAPRAMLTKTRVFASLVCVVREKRATRIPNRGIVFLGNKFP